MAQELVVLERESNGWRVSRLCDPALHGLGWQALSYFGSESRLFATAQNEVEGQGGDIFFLASLDGGLTWQIRGCVIPPHWTTIAKGLRVMSERKAQIVLQQPWLGDDRLPGEPAAGLYTSTTNDGGVTWSTPILVRRCKECDGRLDG